MERELNYNKLIEARVGLTDLVKDQCGMNKIINVKDKDVERLKNLVRNSKNLKLLVFNRKKPASKFLKIKTKNLTFAFQKEVQQLQGVTICIIPSTSGVNAKFSIKCISDLLKSYISSEVNV